ncbi:MAG: MBOAT family protein [Prevotella sp.]|nr:MBOAT family protein [Prevotella sp.]
MGLKTVKNPLWGGKNLLLILISYGLYMQWKPAYALVLLCITAVTYLSALLISKNKAYGKSKYLIIICASLTLIPLIVFKYYNFFNDTVSSLLACVGIATGMPGLNWAIPIGISFFTFQAVGYLFDVYYRRIEAERNWWDYMLFVSFFPQILSGPISKAKDLLPQIKANRQFNYNQAVEGLKFLLWGMFLKVVLADRFGVFVDKVFDFWQNLPWVWCIAGSIAYSFQIYGDFAGYSLMAVGVGKLMGFELVNNFNRPYFSISVTDFWHRWHISLSLWLKDYVYIPLGGSRCSKARNYLNIIITFLVSGIWHGANWTFIVWGALHGVVQVIEKVLGIQQCKNCRTLLKMGRIFITFIIINFLWTIFRTPNIYDGVGFIAKILMLPGDISFGYHFLFFLLMLFVLMAISYCLQKTAKLQKSKMKGECNAKILITVVVFAIAIVAAGINLLILKRPEKMLSIGINNLFFMIISITIVAVSEFFQEFAPSKFSLLNNKIAIIRWLTYILIGMLILLAGVFDSSYFIYLSF